MKLIAREDKNTVGGSVLTKASEVFLESEFTERTHYSNSQNILENLNSPSVLNPQALEGLLQHRPTRNIHGAPMMPENPYAMEAWFRNSPNAFSKSKLYRGQAFAQARAQREPAFLTVGCALATEDAKRKNQGDLFGRPECCQRVSC